MMHDVRLLVCVRTLLCLLVFAPWSAWAAIEAQPSGETRGRLAIVIGNSNYTSKRLEHLPNAANDATALADSLKRLNFDVITGTDLSSEGFAKLFKDAEGRLNNVGSVLIFYAGHGVQVQGENYLLPIDTPDPQNLEKLTAGAVKLNDVIARFANRDRQTFLFLDACRNNPLGAGAGTSNGLAQVEVGENTFVAFATQPGNVTVDGSGVNSPFTTALLKSVEIPGLSISDMMIRVRNETEALTVGRQVPWDQSNLREQFYFTEQQVLDPAQLSASLSQILSDPVAKEKLQIELASNDLQTAVIIVGQTLRSVQLGGTPSSQPNGPQLASLETGPRLDGARQSVISDIETLIVGTGQGTDGEAKTGELAKSVQTELRRLGCYRMAVDGDWGKGSTRALREYYRNTKQDASSTDPSAQLLGDLFLRSGRVCKEPVAVTKKAKPRVASNSNDGGRRGKPATGKAATKKPGKQAVRKPAAPPPDISGGIGIGGIF